MCPHFSDSAAKCEPSKCLFHHTDFIGTDQTLCVTISFTDMLEHFVPQRPPPPQGCGKWCCWTFCIDISFTDILEQFKTHIQNSQVVLMIQISAFLAYPKLKYLQLECKKRSKRFLPVSATTSLSRIVVVPSNSYCSAKDRPRELKLVSLEQPGNGILNMCLKLVQHVCQ